MAWAEATLPPPIAPTARMNMKRINRPPADNVIERMSPFSP
jgi:hypothetical protein